LASTSGFAALGFAAMAFETIFLGAEAAKPVI
jgi:hypothetical protein